MVALCTVGQRLGHEHLAAVRGFHYSCSAVHGRPEVVAIACLRIARVQAAAYFQREVGFDRKSLNAALQLDRCHQRLDGIGERGVHTVAARLYQPAAPSPTTLRHSASWRANRAAIRKNLPYAQFGVPPLAATADRRLNRNIRTIVRS